jgi:tRNA (cmo5U34)-methyltransferase
MCPSLSESMQQPVERRGHNWNVADDVREYVERVDREDRRAEGLSLLPKLVQRNADEPVRVLDVGTGQGLLAALLLDAFPAAVAVGLDASEPMREVAAQRMADYGDRFEFVMGDFVSGELPSELSGPFDVVVSSRAIHHVPSQAKQRLYAAIYRLLGPGGAFFNLDGARPAETDLNPIYRAAGGRPARSRPDEERARLSGHYFETLDEHLEFLRAAGFKLVDCFWKRLDLVLIGGYK